MQKFGDSPGSSSLTGALAPGAHRGISDAPSQLPAGPFREQGSEVQWRKPCFTRGFLGLLHLTSASSPWLLPCWCSLQERAPGPQHGTKSTHLAKDEGLSPAEA